MIAVTILGLVQGISAGVGFLATVGIGGFLAYVIIRRLAR